MATCHLVRLGAFGHVGRFASIDSVRYERDSRVVLRTDRGLELGEILSLAGEIHRSRADGVIVRGMTAEDELIQARLQRHKDEAFEACSARLNQLGLPVTLMDVEHLFDGQSLFFYFLGEPSPEVETVIDELAEVYEAKAQFRKFTETLASGCGPGCGTESATGSGCGSCGTGCAIASACSTRRS